jgi:hypothetical protein
MPGQRILITGLLHYYPVFSVHLLDDRLQRVHQGADALLQLQERRHRGHREVLQDPHCQEGRGRVRLRGHGAVSSGTYVHEHSFLCTVFLCADPDQIER